MLKRIIFILLICSTCFAQKATEVFIPIGQSPGLSGISTLIGTISQVNENNILVNEIVVLVVSDTKIYIDRSKAKLTNYEGTMNDLVIGCFVEVHFFRGSQAEWIKVQN
jgi:hypothetical protein